MIILGPLVSAYPSIIITYCRASSNAPCVPWNSFCWFCWFSLFTLTLCHYNILPSTLCFTVWIPCDQLPLCKNLQPKVYWRDWFPPILRALTSQSSQRFFFFSSVFRFESTVLIIIIFTRMFVVAAAAAAAF